MNSMKLVIPLHFISRKKPSNDAVTPQCQSQFTPKMKANTVLHFLSSLVWIDQYVQWKWRNDKFMELMQCAASKPKCIGTCIGVVIGNSWLLIISDLSNPVISELLFNRYDMIFSCLLVLYTSHTVNLDKFNRLTLNVGHCCSNESKSSKLIWAGPS